QAATARRVLVVDENATSRRILAGFLERLGIRAVCAGDGAAAFDEWKAAEAKGEAYGLLLADAGMPAMDGFALTERVPTAGGNRVPVIVMISAPSRGRAAACCRSERIQYLVNPVLPADLGNAVIRAMQVTDGAPEQASAVRASVTPANSLSI